jgi:hypothetical protein
MTLASARLPRTRWSRYLIAAMLASLTAFAIAQYANGQGVHATNHCTHYTPPYSQDNQWGCTDTHPVSPQTYSTTGTALRDNNYASEGPYSQRLCAWYNAPGIGDYQKACVTGNAVQVGDISYYYAYSKCSFSASSNLGECRTTWHT